MKRNWIQAGVAFLTLVAAIAVFGQDAGTPSKADQVKRGEYLVEQVGMCRDCHTPFDGRGGFVKEKHLHGAPILFKPTVPIPAWAEQSPKIAGLPGWTDEQALKFLTTGVGPQGEQAAPPMPGFRFSEQDASAIIAYLRSLDASSAQVAQK